MKREGYGKSIFEKQRKNIFPWIIGCDFSGTVAEIGTNINKFKIGDEVWGCSSNANSGTHAEFVCIDVDEITHKPDRLDHLKAASMPYVAQTTWFMSYFIYINTYKFSMSARVCIRATTPNLISYFKLRNI